MIIGLLREDRNIYFLCLANCIKGSWFAVEGVSGCVEPTSGSLAGNSLGDFVFLLAFSRVLVSVEAALSNAGLLYYLPTDLVTPLLGTIPGSPIIPLGPAGYVDDVAQPLIAPASEIIDKVRACAAIYHEVFSKYGLTINFKKGKTEALFRFGGPGANAAKKTLIHDMKNQITVTSRGQTFALNASLAYKHVGTTTCSTGSLQPEISTRIGSMNNAFKPLRSVFLTRQNIPIERLLLCQAVLYTKGLFQAGTSPTLHTSEMMRVHKAIMGIYSSLFDTCGSFQDRISHHEISKHERFVAPAVMIIFCVFFIYSCLHACASRNTCDLFPNYRLEPVLDGSC